MTDRLPDGSTDESADVWTEEDLPVNWILRKFHTSILVGIFIMGLTDGQTDRTADGHTDR